ncbi:GNAT family N-acetyltransferase [Panacibacter ginsenosidivorans]|uniref:GNAT family N-acetyltransferase n=1 Tax=Panacibacter ginsenosidivorans TaxID=1813871 RepID=A0A5B8VEK6_9BACT|nr:GNAT family N-acetyltransferase [Panacibacter ginsenosidivorans]QEC69924.1 GNAT family N-acetyltransferase [Panacibacter ginsenosidivorans]
MNIRLQKIAVTDAAFLSEIAIKAYSDHYLHLWHDNAEWYIKESFSVGNLEKELADINALFYIIYSNEEPVGFLKLNIDAAFENYTSKKALELERIYLRKNASQKGIGEFVMKFVFDLAISKNKTIVWLKVMDSSTGPISFYKKHGFEICGSLQLDFPVMKEEVRGMYIMKKIL